MKNRNLLFLLAITFLGSSSFAQQINLTNPTMTPVDAVENVLLGAGINAFNITYNGSAADAANAQGNVKEFNNGTSTFPISSGVLMHTDGPNISDPDLTDASGGTITNGAIIEFDFVPTGDTLSFNYVFASTEYTSFTCSQYNDVFGFFISGPGITGPYSNGAENIATVPGSPTIPVAINTVNNGTDNDSGDYCNDADPNWQSNSVFFTTGNNTTFGNSPSPISGFNGSTVVLPANSGLSCNDTFHIKIAIANVFDTALDSGVFLEANSFSSSGVDISIETGASITDTLLVEGCTEGTIYFTRPENQSDSTLTITFETSGTATQGDDYPVLAPGDSVIFLPGEDTISLTISPIDDGIAEGLEELTITAYTISACGDTIQTEGTIWIGDEPYSVVQASDTTILCANDSVPLSANTTGGFPPYTHDWSNGETGNPIPAAGIENGETDYTVTSTDACGFEYTDTSTITLNQTLAIDTMIQSPTECDTATGYVSGTGSGFTGTPDYIWTGPGSNSSNYINASVWQGLSSGWYYFSIEDDVCIVEDSILLEQEPPPNASFDADPPIGASPLNVTFTNTSDPATTYDWDFGNGQSNSVNDLSSQNSTYIDEGSYTVTLTLTLGSCTNQATKEVIVSSPVIYDLPNIFTPNDDETNDVFKINAENATGIDLVIVNRWGNVVFESTDPNFEWNGQKDNSGPECTEGTYFYKFTITDIKENEVDEQGFVQLVRGK